MTRRFVGDLADGDAVEEVLLVRDKQVRTNRNGAPYLQLDLDDRSGSVSARFWNATEADCRAFEPGDFLRIRGKAQLFQGQMQVIIHQYERVEPTEAELADFIPSTEQDVRGLLEELTASLGRIRTPALAAIAKAFLVDEKLLSAISRAPAGVRNHHAYVGGLLEHVVTLLRVAERIEDVYPNLDHDVLKMGIFLHDLGKVRELTYDRGFSYTDEGQLIGHLVIGVELLSDKLPLAAEILGEPIPEETVLVLKHMIVSHHGTHEFGSPKLPMTAEAIALHHLDNLDAKVHNFSRTIQTDPNPTSSWTPYDPALTRRLYKGPTSRRGTSV